MRDMDLRVLHLREACSTLQFLFVSETSIDSHGNSGKVMLSTLEKSLPLETLIMPPKVNVQ